MDEHKTHLESNILSCKTLKYLQTKRHFRFASLRDVFDSEDAEIINDDDVLILVLLTGEIIETLFNDEEDSVVVDSDDEQFDFGDNKELVCDNGDDEEELIFDNDSESVFIEQGLMLLACGFDIL